MQIEMFDSDLIKHGWTVSAYFAGVILVWRQAKQTFLRSTIFDIDDYSFLSTFSAEFWTSERRLHRAANFYALGVTIAFLLIAGTGNIAYVKVQQPADMSFGSPILAVALAFVALLANPVEPFKIFEQMWRSTMYDFALIPSEVRTLASTISATSISLSSPNSAAAEFVSPVLKRSEIERLSLASFPSVWSRTRIAQILFILRSLRDPDTAVKIRSKTTLSVAFQEKVSWLQDALAAVLASVNERQIVQSFRRQKDRSACISIYEERLSKYDKELSDILRHAELLLACCIASRQEPMNQDTALSMLGFLLNPESKEDNNIDQRQGSWVAVSFMGGLVPAAAIITLGMRASDFLPSLPSGLMWPKSQFYPQNVFFAFHFVYVPLAISIYASIVIRKKQIFSKRYRTVDWIAPVAFTSFITSYVTIFVIRAIQIAMDRTIVFERKTMASCRNMPQTEEFPAICILAGQVFEQMLSAALVMLCCIILIWTLNRPIVRGIQSYYTPNLKTHIRWGAVVILLFILSFLANINIFDGLANPIAGKEFFGIALIMSIGFLAFLIGFYISLAWISTSFQSYMRATESVNLR
jgi:hypothetical protein